MSHDELFRNRRELINDFDFGKDTAQVFDDMLNRSVPFYSEIQRMMAEMAAYFAVEHVIKDLGSIFPKIKIIDKLSFTSEQFIV